MTLARDLRSAARYVRPRYWRWRRTLQSLDLDPEMLPRPLEAPGLGDIIICGSPRSGTTLAAAIVHRPPQSVAVMEPWDGMRLPPAHLFRSLRQEIATGRLERGRLDLGALAGDGAVRWKREASSAEAIQAVPGHLLAVKWPAYWRYLELLPESRFIVCLRHPYEVISSYERTGGRLQAGYDYDIPFNRPMNDFLTTVTPDPRERRIYLYEYIHSRIVTHLARTSVYPLRYERWRSEPSLVLKELSEFLNVDLTESQIEIDPPPPAEPSHADRALIRSICSTAGRLGYTI